MSVPAVSVIISNFNGAKFLPRLLASLRGQSGVTVEIVVVDRNSTDESPSILAAYGGVKVVMEPPESGLVTGYAVGAAHATSDLLFFCNEDMWFDPECLSRLSARIDLAARVAAADPWQWTYDGQTWIHGGTRFHRARLDLNSPDPFRRYEFTAPLDEGDAVPFGCAGAILIHRVLYESVGGWDRGFFLDNEDVDFFIRAWQAGWTCVTVPAARVYHAVNVSNAKAIQGGKPVSRRRYISGRSGIMVLGVKYFSLSYVILLVGLWVGILIRHAIFLNRTRFWWSVLAGKEFLARLPAALKCRFDRRSGHWRRGERLFRAREFQLPG